MLGSHVPCMTCSRTPAQSLRQSELGHNLIHLFTFLCTRRCQPYCPPSTACWLLSCWALPEYSVRSYPRFCALHLASRPCSGCLCACRACEVPGLDCVQSTFRLGSAQTWSALSFFKTSSAQIFSHLPVSPMLLASCQPCHRQRPSNLAQTGEE